MRRNMFIGLLCLVLVLSTAPLYAQQKPAPPKLRHLSLLMGGPW